MRKILKTLALLALFPVVAIAQGALPPSTVRAVEFNLWSFNSQAANTFTFSGTNCQVYPLTSGALPSFFAFGPTATPYPVFIRDANPTNSEIVTPSATSTVVGACGFSASPVNQHTSFTVLSGTAGLQEAVGSLKSTATPAWPWTVVIDRAYYLAVSGLPSGSVPSIINNLKGSVNVQIVDNTTAPWTYYVWSGTAYVPRGGATVPPTLACSTGAGTSPTCTSITGSAEQGTISITTGTTPTASAAVLTLTYPAIASGGPNYAIACTFTSIGTNSYTSGVASSVAGPPAVATLTASATALTASTAYVFSYRCN